jgi:hypothetical protein
MMTYSRLNKQKEIKCREEGIDRAQAGLFRDMGDTSPLCRYIVISIYLTKEAYSIAGIASSMILEEAISIPDRFQFFYRTMNCTISTMKTEYYANKEYDFNKL